MSTEGIFHDAHEVYLVSGEERTWVATFSSKSFAEGYTKLADSYAARFGVYPEADEFWAVVPV